MLESQFKFICLICVSYAQEHSSHRCMHLFGKSMRLVDSDVMFDVPSMTAVPKDVSNAESRVESWENPRS